MNMSDDREHEPFDDDSGDPYGLNEPFPLGEPHALPHARPLPFGLPPDLAAELAKDEAEIKARVERLAETMGVVTQAEAAAEAGAEQMRRLLEAGATDGNTDLIWSMLGTLAARQLALAASIGTLRDMHANTSCCIVRQMAMMEMVRRQLERIIDEGGEGEAWKRGGRPEDGE